ncbi:MAG: DinB family protein [Actinomycetota bacterium]
MSTATIDDLLAEYERAISYTRDLWADLTADEVQWRPDENSSAIGWHLGHQPAVAHFMVRNLTAAEPSPDPELDGLMDSATSEADRGDLPDVARLTDYRDAVAERVRYRIGQIDEGNVGAPTQLRIVAKTLLVAVINHEYQHDKWIGEVRNETFGKDLPPDPRSDRLQLVDGYLMVGA